MSRATLADEPTKGGNKKSWHKILKELLLIMDHEITSESRHVLSTHSSGPH